MVTFDKRDTIRRAKSALEEGRAADAVAPLWSLLDRTHVVDEEFAGHLRLLSRALSMLKLSRAVVSIHLYLREHDAAFRAAQGQVRDMARCAVAAGRNRDAARLFEEAGWLGHAAIQLEEAGDDRSARVLWERLADDGRLRSHLYTRGLVHFNLGRACQRLGDHPAARRANVQAMHLLEGAADGYETQGLRERAFDCFQVLLTLGKEGAFENLAEGYLNCIRILQEDNLKYYVLQYYEDFQELALGRGELHTAATLFREAADFSRRHNLPYERHYRGRAADTHASAARHTIAEGASVELAENAYAAAIDAFNSLGAYSNVSQMYRALSALPLAEKRKARYHRLAERLSSVRDEVGENVGFPAYLRMDTAYPEIWRLDVIEWEQGGDAAETMAEVLSDPKWQEFTRRRALLCQLHQLISAQGAATPATLVGLAAHLGRVEIYASLSPLEHLYEHEDPSVRAAAMAAVRQLFFKRSFIVVMKGLLDPDARVRREALNAVTTLHFPHAFDPLARIYREASEPDVRRAALSSIGRIPTVEAAELLVDVIRHGDPEERAQVTQLLARAEHPEVGNVLRRAVAEETGAAREAIQKVLQVRA